MVCSYNTHMGTVPSSAGARTSQVAPGTGRSGQTAEAWCWPVTRTVLGMCMLQHACSQPAGRRKGWHLPQVACA
jgi:hypothetical protein